MALKSGNDLARSALRINSLIISSPWMREEEIFGPSVLSTCFKIICMASSLLMSAKHFSAGNSCFDVKPMTPRISLETLE